MGCLPESNGCERQRTDPFVRHLNEVESRDFRHQLCLDRVFRNTPQPEALYVDAGTGIRLVIERKTIAWPRDYIVRHQNDHLVAEILCDKLGARLADAPYAIVLECALRGRPSELRVFAGQIVESVLRRFPEVETGRGIGSPTWGRRWRIIREPPDDRIAEDEPPHGLVIRWFPTEASPQPYADASDELLAEVGRHLVSCASKFRDYAGDRRVVLLDQQGELRYWSCRSWQRAFHLSPPPAEVPEIWMAIHDWIADDELGWIFERLYRVA